ncbi:adenosylcobinamide-phosphate synthase [Methylophilus rhizosphaerae]|uniref:Cobalamin biosynthesis protein CobD n=1 Tax=Methylophilus rhizosphaerae TaxID=492660 RepID=A0A1G9DWB7_9PROT|nr:adenosylcobinamide-phosphate synthase CbiB [Methylophilus rhizosphaerae]SDK68110.1 adenosylcobinamide-phosphate synthase [Methylophilus rhizosphaerae]
MFLLPAFPSADYLILALLACGAVVLDRCLGEPQRWHPLVGFGRLASLLSHQLNPPARQPKTAQRLTGLLAWALAVLPFTYLAWELTQTRFGWLVHGYLLYFALGHQSLRQHALAVYSALQNNDFPQAQRAASYMVSRDREAIEPVSSTLESVLENGNDGVFAALFWFLVAGGPGALLYRLANTLDAMWGYKTSQYYYFGWAAARLDDVLNYMPARLTALTYALLGNTSKGLYAWRMQAKQWDSPNAGPVMSAGAGALNVALGGRARYHGVWHERPALGTTVPPTMHDIPRALKLVSAGLYSWLIIAVLAGVIAYA